MSRRALLIVAGVVAVLFVTLTAVLAVGVFAGYQSESTRTVQEPKIIWQECGGEGQPPCPPAVRRPPDAAR